MDIKNYKASPDLLKDRVILVTGAGSGIGAVAAKTYARHGATVVLLGKTINKLEAVYDEIKAAGGPEPALYPLNLMGATLKDYAEMAQTITNELGQLNGILHNAAFVGDTTPIQHYDAELWHRVLHINLTAPFLLTQSCIGLLQQSANPRILFTTHQVTSAYWGAYGVAKAGIERLMSILADELDGDKAVSVNAVIPGELQSPLMAKVYPGKNLQALKPIDSIMPLYLYLIGNENENETGQIFNAETLLD